MKKYLKIAIFVSILPTLFILLSVLKSSAFADANIVANTLDYIKSIKPEEDKTSTSENTIARTTTKLNTNKTTTESIIGTKQSENIKKGQTSSDTESETDTTNTKNTETKTATTSTTTPQNTNTSPNVLSPIELAILSSKNTSSSPTTIVYVNNNTSTVLEGVTISSNGDLTFGEKEWQIKNENTAQSKLFVKIINIKNKENGCNDQEKVLDNDCNNDLTGGDIGNAMIISILNNNTVLATTTLGKKSSDDFGTIFTQNPVIFQANETKPIKMRWQIKPEAYTNIIQGDELSFNVTFRLEGI